MQTLTFGTLEIGEDGDHRGYASHSFQKSSSCFLNGARGLQSSIYFVYFDNLNEKNACLYISYFFIAGF